jgi:mono/diheme cytochrome c family protein
MARLDWRSIAVGARGSKSGPLGEAAGEGGKGGRWRCRRPDAAWCAAVFAALLVVAAAVAGAGGPAGAAGSPRDAAMRGQVIAETYCARCHAVGRSDTSPLAIAPTFPEIAVRYPPEHLAEALAEGIETRHLEMPRFRFEPPDIDALLLYLESLAPPPPRRSR